MSTKRAKRFIAIIIAVLLTACTPESHNNGIAVHRDSYIYEYHSNNDMLFWYIMFSNVNNHSCPCYAFNSPTAVTVSSFRDMPFERTTKLPQKVEEAVDKEGNAAKIVGSDKELPENLQAEAIADENMALEASTSSSNADVKEEAREAQPEYEGPAESSTEASSEGSSSPEGAGSGGSSSE